MCDASDIEVAIVGLIVAAVYPNGTTQPSVVGQLVSVERGWPTEADIRYAAVNDYQLIRVYAVPGMSRDTERYERAWQAQMPTTPSLTATLAANVITFGGTVTAGLIASVQSGGKAYNYVCQANDTPASVATALAALVPGASAAGDVLTLAAAGPIPFVGIYSPSTGTMEVGRQQQVFAISLWATTPALRDQVFKALGPALATTYRITLPDSSIATRIGRSLQTSGPDDLPSRADEWRRDMRLMWDWPIIVSMQAPPAAAVETAIYPNGATEPVVTVIAR